MAIRLSLVFFGLVFTASASNTKSPHIKQIIVDDARCYGQSTGSAQIVVSGGKPPYQYSLDGKHFQRQDVFKFLKAGHYQVYLKDSENDLCTSTFTVYQPEKIHFSPAKTTHSSCCYPDGAVLVHAQGGTGTLQYQLNDSPFQESGYFNGLSGGYTVVAKDSVGCKTSQIVKIDDFSGPRIDFMNSTEVTCYGGNNGSITVFSIGGSGNVSYSINGGKTWQHNPHFTDLKAGIYLAKVKDETGCADSLSIVISQPPLLEVSATCTTNDNGTYAATICVEYSIGGTGPHVYRLDNGDYQNAGIFKTPAAGEHILYVKDRAGCTTQNLVNTITGKKDITKTARHK